MKRSNSIYIVIGLFFIITSCANLEKMVETGNYDKALDIAVRKMAGKKNKKAKYVQAAEEAFVKVTQRDMDRISQLKIRNGVDDWEKIYSIANTMMKRQESIQPLLPLLDKEGYHAGFKFVKADIIRDEAAGILSKAFFKRGNEAMMDARRSDKLAAREAYELFDRVLFYAPNTHDASTLKDEAEQLGITHILVQLENRSNAILPLRMEDELLSFYNAGRQSQWKVFHINKPTNTNMDYIGRVIVSDLNVSPELVQETIHNFYKQVSETHYARDANGQIMRDTLGNKISIQVPKDIRAQVVEVKQSKEAAVEMIVEIISTSQNQVVRTERMAASGLFQNDACRIQGDRRAVEGRWLELGEPLLFPSDEALLLNAADGLKNQVSDYLTSFNFERT